MPTQDERRRATRQRLVDAAAEVLEARGSAGFTTTEVGRRAGLSQGAVFKHFATKADLLAATVESIFAGLVTRYEGEFVARAAVAQPSVAHSGAIPAAIPAGATAARATPSGVERATLAAGETSGVDGLTARLHAGLDLLWEVFQDPRLLAAYDLFAAARTDPDLQRDLQPVVRAHVDNLHALARALFPDADAVDPDRLRDAVDLAAATMQGLVMNRMAVADPDVEDRVRALLHRWVGDRLLELVGASSPADSNPLPAATNSVAADSVAIGGANS